MNATTVEPRTWSLSGSVLATAPIIHGDGVLGTTTTIRTVRVVQPDGTTADVPAVSGNAVRGRLRRISADLAWEHAGKPLLTPAAFRTLYQGGNLTKNQKRIPSETVTAIRSAVPHLSLFGWAGGGRIIEGRSSVAGMVPLCDETAHILDDTMPGSFWERLDVMEHSRMEDTIRSTRQDRLDPTFEVAAEDSTQMRFGVQVIAAGTRLAWAFSVFDPTPAEIAHARLTLTLWAADGATVGGRAAAGFGRLRLDRMGEWVAGGDDLDVLASHHKANTGSIAKAFQCLAE